MKLITQNIYCLIPWESKKEITLKNFYQQNPDILCIQELISGKKNSSIEANDIAKELNMSFYFVDSYNNMTNQGIFVKKERNIKERENYLFNLSGSLPDGELEKHQRYIVAKLLEIDGKELLIINLHLSVLKPFRYQNWQETMVWLKNSGLIKKNIMIVGDLNTYDDDDIHIEIAKDFKNAWDEVNKEKCISYYSSDWWIKNFPESHISKNIIGKDKHWNDNCLDFIFYKGDIKINSVEYLDMVPKETDHKGLILDFNV